jgi:hypothetical protein
VSIEFERGASNREICTISPASLAPPSPRGGPGRRPERHEIAVSRRVSVVEAQFHGAEPACRNGDKLRKYGQNGTPVTPLVRYHSRHVDTPLTHVTLERSRAGGKHPQSRDLGTKTVQIGRPEGDRRIRISPEAAEDGVRGLRNRSGAGHVTSHGRAAETLPGRPVSISHVRARITGADSGYEY